MACVFKNIADLFSKQEKNTRYTQFAKITEQLRLYQIQRNILVDKQFSHDFFEMVVVLMEGCFGSCFFQFTEIKSAIFFLMRAIEAFQRK